MPSSKQTSKFGLSQYSPDDAVTFLQNYNEDMRRIEENAVHKGDTVTSDTPPENPTDGMIWRKPVGNLSLAVEIGGNVSTTVVQFAGTDFSEEPPEDKNTLWVTRKGTI